MSGEKEMTAICPYTGLPDTIFTDEHIFPHALGGGLDYSIRVSKKANNELGSSLDAALANSSTIKILRLQHGIRSRTGEPEWRMRATLMPRNVEAEIVFRSDGSLEQRILKPVESYDEIGGALILGPDQVDQFLKKFIDGQQKKGREVIIRDRSPESGSHYKIDITLDTQMLTRAMTKIAFGALYEYLGDKFLGDPLVGEWRKALFSQDRDEVKSSRIRGSAFVDPKMVSLLFPNLQPHEHGVAIANLGKNYTICGVTLFGTRFHNLITRASETDSFGLEEGQGIIIVCDAKTRNITRKDFLTEMLPKIS
jgi:hypothetical protein